MHYSLRPTAPGLLLTLSAALLIPLAALADSPSSGVRVRFDTGDLAGSPFPSNRYTQPDWSNRTFRRVNLPTPDCTVRVSDCEDIRVSTPSTGSRPSRASPCRSPAPSMSPA